jgi:hypothetical protein
MQIKIFKKVWSKFWIELRLIINHFNPFPCFLDHYKFTLFPILSTYIRYIPCLSFWIIWTETMKMLSKIFLLVAATTVFIISIGQGLEPCCAHPSICLPIICKDPPCCIPNDSLDQPMHAGDSLDHDSDMDKPKSIVIICMAIFMCILLILFMIYLPCSRPRIPL